MYLSEEAHIKDFINREFQKHFNKDEVNISERVRLVSDLYKFRSDVLTGDKFFYDQKIGKVPRFYSVYFDDEFVCRFDSTYPAEAIQLLFWRGLTQLYETHKIYFDKSLYKAEEDYDKQIKRAEKEAKTKKVKETIRKIKGANEEAEMAAQVIDSLEKDKGIA